MRGLDPKHRMFTVNLGAGGPSCAQLSPPPSSPAPPVEQGERGEQARGSFRSKMGAERQMGFLFQHAPVPT